MHDHLYPGNTMVVEVVGEDSATGPIDAIKEMFRGILDRFANVIQKEPADLRALEYSEQQKTIKSMSSRDPASAWKFLKDSFIVNGQITENPHELAHIVGNNLYKKMGIDGIAACDPTFAFGCYHGVTEKMLLELGVDAVPSIESTCVKIFPSEQALIASCVHGTGHGLLTYEGLDVGAALEDCDALSPQNRGYCYDGVFMEHSFSAPEIANEWTMCASLDEKYHPECAKYHVYNVGQHVGWDLSTMAQSCEAAPTQALRVNCFSGLGFFSANAARGELEGVKRNCGLALSED